MFCFIKINILFLRYHDGTSPLPNMSDLLALLHTNSPLSLIHRYLDVQTVDSTEILDKLQKTLVDIDDKKEQRPRKKGRFTKVFFIIKFPITLLFYLHR